MDYKSYKSRSTEETKAIARELAPSLQGGEVIALYGDLGAGKTAFVQGLAEGLGVKQIVNSPTFSIMNIYEIKTGAIRRFCHIDTYRLTSTSELREIGALDYISAKDVVCAIEWAEKAEEIIGSGDLIKVRIEAVSVEERIINISKI
ncbi:MAG: tRNA (adenosine(37)-N6)-threonylcarbamoyltransferase complex ATPase subunit type 1 TsaE [Bacillota bacterium]